MLQNRPDSVDRLDGKSLTDERLNLLLMPRKKSRRSAATAIDPRPVTRVETVPAAQEATLKASMREAGYAPWTRREDSGLVTIRFILSARRHQVAYGWRRESRVAHC